MRYLEAVPAYGRDYTSAAAVRKDWKEGKDFQIQAFGDPADGRYVNIGDKPADLALTIRYNGLRSVVVVK